MKALKLACVALAMSAAAHAQEFQQGVHYQLIQPPQPTNDASKVEVVEAFGYLCPHCANFQPFIEPWQESAPDYVSYIRMPVLFQRAWEPLGRAYYVAEAMGVVDQIHMPLFDALHKQRRRLTNDEDIADFFAEQGIDREAYLKTAKSFAVETKMRRTVTLTQRYGISGTPSIVINGKYLAMARMAGGNNELIQLIDYLVKKEAAELPQAEAVEEGADEQGASGSPRSAASLMPGGHGRVDYSAAQLGFRWRGRPAAPADLQHPGRHHHGQLPALRNPGLETGAAPPGPHRQPGCHRPTAHRVRHRRPSGGR
jgi:thiol:disulfide interchange protein DsbA